MAKKVRKARKSKARTSEAKANKAKPAKSARSPGRPKSAARKTARKGPAKAASLADTAFEAIKEKILKLYFLPGQYLNEGALCALLGVGRTPVHQALQRLQHEGLVEIMPRKGVIVQPGSISEILKILDSRATVEADLARNAASHVTQKAADELKMLARAGVSNGTPSELENFIEADRAFHSKFAELAENPVLSEFARSLHERSIRYWYLHLWQTFDGKASTREHTAIADAIARGDGDGAAKAVRTHIESLRNRLMRAQEASRGRGPMPPMK
jgi:GntR family transcriptional regulator, rspAB operon transcriptional repressor